MSKTVCFYGSSDDLLICLGDTYTELDCFRPSYHLKSKEGELLVVGHFGYGTPGFKDTWVIGVTLVKPGSPVPSWPMRFETAPVPGNRSTEPYSPMLIIEGPDDLQVTPIHRTE